MSFRSQSSTLKELIFEVDQLIFFMRDFYEDFWRLLGQMPQLQKLQLKDQQFMSMTQFEVKWKHFKMENGFDIFRPLFQPMWHLMINIFALHDLLMLIWFLFFYFQPDTRFCLQNLKVLSVEVSSLSFFSRCQFHQRFMRSFYQGCHLAFFETVCQKRNDLAIWPFLMLTKVVYFKALFGQIWANFEQFMKFQIFI